MLQTIRKFILDCIFPIRCLGGCGCWDKWLCATCLQPIMLNSEHSMPIGKSISTLYFLNYYQDYRMLRRAIQQLKYQALHTIGPELGEQLRQCIPIANYDYIVPVPLHKQRLRERGFNQSERIARGIGLPIFPALQRTRYTTAQATLNREQRLHNLTNAFCLNPTTNYQLLHSRILLVDDVYTTGSTVQTCATILRNAGVSQVDAAVIAVD